MRFFDILKLKSLKNKTLQGCRTPSKIIVLVVDAFFVLYLTTGVL